MLFLRYDATTHAPLLRNPVFVLLFGVYRRRPVSTELLPRQATSAPGQFDYYVLSLSWSPQYCANPTTLAVTKSNVDPADGTPLSHTDFGPITIVLRTHASAHRARPCRLT